MVAIKVFCKLFQIFYYKELNEELRAEKYCISILFRVEQWLKSLNKEMLIFISFIYIEWQRIIEFIIYFSDCFILLLLSVTKPWQKGEFML